MIVLLSRSPLLVSDMRVGALSHALTGWASNSCSVLGRWQYSLTAEVRCPGANSPSLHRVVKEQNKSNKKLSFLSTVSSLPPVILGLN